MEIEKKEPTLIQQIEDFYLPRHLVNAIFEIGKIPASSQESNVGVGFIDIADYTYLSRFLSPKENQTLLNGLYTAFQIVLERHGGFLNKIEGDAMMFHFDDILDKRLWDKNKENRIALIASELFYTCVEMQKACIHFNQADTDFLDEGATPEAKEALAAAFEIITTLRSKNDISSTLFAFFQIRIRIGANVGEVTIGNFGPDGSKHWDVIGLPVINAKRMESTAPIGGLRISDDFFKILEANGITEKYFTHFREEAKKLGSVYQNISFEELFKFREVVVQNKKGAIYKTYSVQVYPSLPESITMQTEELIKHGKKGVDQIVEFFRYYRANQFVIDGLEKMLSSKGIVFRKDEMLTIIFTKLSSKNKPKKTLTLYELFTYMDKYLDYIQEKSDDFSSPLFFSYDQYTSTVKEKTLSLYENQKLCVLQQSWFNLVITPLIYGSLEASLLEYQLQLEELEEPEEI